MTSELIHAALAELGVRRMLLAIHDASFPSDPDEDLGRGSPATAASARLFAFARSLGFTGIQLGPQGQTSRDNPSPYDGTIFSRHTGTIALRSFRPGGAYAGLVEQASIDRAIVDAPGGPVQHRRARDAIGALIDEAFGAYAGEPTGQQAPLGGEPPRDVRPDLRLRQAQLIGAYGALGRDALYTAYCDHYGGASFRHWHPQHAARWKTQHDARIEEASPRVIERYLFGQLLAHEEHARVRATCASLGLMLYGDLQVGYSDADAWAYPNVFLDDYVMGAPPSRTNPDGQPWNYPVLDPAQFDGAARALLVARIDKAFDEYDSIRIDHPHGLVCPWVYPAHTGDPARAVRDGARLYESPDLDDHPSLARFAIATPEQLDRTLPRYHDHWVRMLTVEQVARYSILFDAIAESASRHGRALADLSCEVLSTMPVPLTRVLDRHGLGRWRVLQKANLDDPTDVYRMENAAHPDWVMLGNHDTAPIFALARGWDAATRDKWTRHLTTRLSLGAVEQQHLAADSAHLPTAMLAELFASDAENVSIFFADLFGYHERFNVPGTISDANWSLRLPADFERLYRDRLAHHAALDIPRALALALDARNSTSGLAAKLVK